MTSEDVLERAGFTAAELKGHCFQVLEDLDFGLQFGDGARSRCLVDDDLLCLLDLRIGCVVQFIDIFIREAGQTLVILQSPTAF